MHKANLDSSNVTQVEELKALNKEIPDALDWRDLGAVTPPKHQGGCSSCWSFAVVTCH